MVDASPGVVIRTDSASRSAAGAEKPAKPNWILSRAPDHLGRFRLTIRDADKCLSQRGKATLVRTPDVTLAALFAVCIPSVALSSASARSSSAVKGARIAEHRALSQSRQLQRLLELASDRREHRFAEHRHPDSDPIGLGMAQHGIQQCP